MERETEEKREADNRYRRNEIHTHTHEHFHSRKWTLKQRGPLIKQVNISLVEKRKQAKKNNNSYTSPPNQSKMKSNA